MTTDDKPSFAVIIPINYEIYSTQNSQNQFINIDTTWYKQNIIDYIINGNITTKYQVYVSPSSIAAEYRNIKIRKKQ